MALYTFNGRSYTISQINGQRITTLVGWSDTNEQDLDEIFISGLPRFVVEDTLMPLLSEYGLILKLRLMMCYSGSNRGFCYVIYQDQSILNYIISHLMTRKIENQKIFVARSFNVRAIQIKNISKHLANLTIKNLIITETAPTQLHFIIEENFKHVIVHYKSHRDAALSRRLLIANVFSFGPSAIIKWFKT